MYEIIPGGVKTRLLENVDPLKYQQVAAAKGTPSGSELMNIKLRYKKPDSDSSKMLEHPVAESRKSWREASEDFRFAAAVVGYGMILQQSEFKGDLNYKAIEQMVKTSLGEDKEGYRREFLAMVKNTAKLDIKETNDEDLSLRKFR